MLLVSLEFLTSSHGKRFSHLLLYLFIEDSIISRRKLLANRTNMYRCFNGLWMRMLHFKFQSVQCVWWVAHHSMIRSSHCTPKCLWIFLSRPPAMNLSLPPLLQQTLPRQILIGWTRKNIPVDWRRHAYHFHALCNTINPILISIFRPLLPWHPRLVICSCIFVHVYRIHQKKTKKSMIVSRVQLVHVLLLMFPFCWILFTESKTGVHVDNRGNYLWLAPRQRWIHSDFSYAWIWIRHYSSTCSIILFEVGIQGGYFSLV